MNENRPSFRRSLALGVALGAGVSGLVLLLAGCEAKTTERTQPPRPLTPALPQGRTVVMSAAVLADAPKTNLALSVSTSGPPYVSAPPQLSRNRGSLTLEWDASADTNVVGYRIYYGTEGGNYTQSADAKEKTRATIVGLPEGVRCYFRAVSYDASGTESAMSNEATGIPPFQVRLFQDRWRVEAFGMLGQTNVMQSSTDLTNWKPVLEWVGMIEATNYLHTNQTHAWFRVIVK